METFNGRDLSPPPAGPGDEPVGERESRLRTRRQAIKVAQEIVARRVPKARDLVAELIAERREEAARE